MDLQIITELSKLFGSEEYVLQGGGNTSFKDDKYLYIKPSGISLADMKPELFVKLDRSIVRQSLDLVSIEDVYEKERRIAALLTYAALEPAGARPSVESPIHELMPYKFVVHTHPTLVNAMTCGKNGKEICARLFPEAIWLDYCSAGLSVAEGFKKAADAFSGEPKVAFLGNHGVFVAADTAEEIKAIYAHIMTTLSEYVTAQGIALKLDPVPCDMDTVFEYAPILRGLLGKAATVTAGGVFKVAEGGLTPHHVMYANTCPDRKSVV